MSDSPIKIDKNVPLPASHAEAPFPFAEMLIGDSFLAPCAEGAALRVQNRLLAATHRRKLQGKKFITRKADGGVRVWRVE